jgi:dihydroorotase
MKPPLRSCCDVDAAIEGIADGTVDALATDHAPHPGSEKMQEFEKCPFGILGLETAIGLTFQKLVHTGKIPLMKMIELYTTGPANVLRLNRGTLAIGAAADVTVLDPTRPWTYDVNQSPSKSRNTPFHGAGFIGGPVATIVNGSFVWRKEQ